MFEIRGRPSPSSPSSSTSVMTVKCLEEGGATTSRVTPLMDAAGLELDEYCDVGDTVDMLLLAGM